MTFNDSKYNHDWNIKTLNQLGEFKRGKSKHRPRNDKKLFINGRYPLIQTGEISEATLYINKHAEMYNDFGLKQSKLWKKNTLCITIAANIAETALLGYPMCFPDSVVGFTAFPKESSELFMHYLLTYLKKTIQNSASGSIQDNINIEYLTQLSCRIPGKDIQDNIAAVLSALDLKIELNQRINFELESIARTLYDYWFVQFDFPNEKGQPYKTSGGKMIWNGDLKRDIPFGWKCCELSDIVSRIGTGLNPRKNFVFGNGNNYYVTITNIEYGKVVLSEKCDKVDDEALKIINKRSDLQIGDILFTSIEPVGKTYLLQEKPENWNINESVFTLRPNYDMVTPEYLYLLLSSKEMKLFTKKSSSGSTFKGIRIGVLNTYLSSYSNRKIISNFSRIIKPILRKINVVQKESQTLLELRDWLLPLLMNGQIKVRN